MLFKKKKDNAQCRYCKRVCEEDGFYSCRLRGRVKASDCCLLYKFDPFAKREPLRRNPDVSAFDPLDFEI